MADAIPEKQHNVEERVSKALKSIALLIEAAAKQERDRTAAKIAAKEQELAMQQKSRESYRQAGWGAQQKG